MFLTPIVLLGMLIRELASEQESNKGEEVAKSRSISKRIRILLIGDSGVGKHKLISYLTIKNEEVIDCSKEPISYTTEIEVECGVKVQLEMWTANGTTWIRKFLETYQAEPGYGILLLYDTTNAQSFKNIPNWYRDAKRIASPDALPVFAVVGCKTDLCCFGQEDNLQEEAEEFALDNGISFVETSAVTGENIDDLFILLSQRILGKI